MNAARRSLTNKQLAERLFPYRIDILVPPFGLGQRLNEMLAWCAENLEPGTWDHHGHSEPRGRGVVPKEYARFYFMDAGKAELFRNVSSKFNQ